LKKHFATIRKDCLDYTTFYIKRFIVSGAYPVSFQGTQRELVDNRQL